MTAPEDRREVSPLPSQLRPIDATPIHTEDLPATPTRDRSIPASAWLEAPADLLAVGDDLALGDARYLRRIGPWLLWRAGPAKGADAVYWVCDARDLGRTSTFRLFPDGNGEGAGPSGEVHTRFRAWKEDLRDAEDR